MKMNIKNLGVGLSLVLALAFIVPERAAAVGENSNVDTSVATIISEDQVSNIQGKQEIKEENQLKMINPVRYRKTNVKRYQSKGKWRRVSATVTTGPEGGSITCNKELEFSGSVSGTIKGIIVYFGGTVKSNMGYTLRVGPNRTTYMEYRPVYDVETGTREVYDAIKNKVIKRNSYTAKRAVDGEYRLAR